MALNTDVGCIQLYTPPATPYARLGSAAATSRDSARIRRHSRLNGLDRRHRRRSEDDMPETSQETGQHGSSISRPDQHAVQTKPFVPAISLHAAEPALFAMQDDLKVAMEYFHHLSLPIFSRLEPTPIWPLMLSELYSDPGLCNIAAALGHQHRYMLHATASSAVESQKYYIRAIRSLARIIDEEGQKRLSTVIFACYLLATLEAFKGCFAEMLTHLRFGTRIALQTPTKHLVMRESTRLLKKTTVHAVAYNLASQEAQMTLGALIGSDPVLAPKAEDLQDDQTFFSELQNIMLKMLAMSNPPRRVDSRNRGTITLLRDFDEHPELQPVLHDLRTRHAALELVAASKLESCSRDNVVRHAFLSLIKARSLFTGVYLRCAWYDDHAAFDEEVDAFREMIDLIEDALRQLHNRIDKDEHKSEIFSVGLGVLPLLRFIVEYCRHHETRHKGIELMDLCPSREGLWTAKFIKALTTAFVAFEESKAAECSDFEKTRYIPEHCRIHFCHQNTAEDDPTRRRLRLFRILFEDSPTYWYDDIEVEV